MSETPVRNLTAQPFDYWDEGDPFEGYVVAPSKTSAPLPCVLLAHDWSGLTAPTRDLAHRYAARNYICFALDVYGKGRRGDPLGDNTHLMAPLMENRALLRRRLLAGYHAAAHLPGVDAERMATAGYCFGGLCALDLARTGADLKAAVSFHGGLQAPRLEDNPGIKASVLLLHGWEDPMVPREDMLAITEELTNSGADWQLHIYGHALHAFTFEEATFPDRGILYNRLADKRSWAAMLSHLEEAFTGERKNGDAEQD